MENIISFESAVYKENIFNPERLKAARTYRGLSVTELASRLDMQRQRLSMYENNRIDKPEILVIRKIAEALDFPVKFFLEKDINRNDSSAIYFRSLLSTNKRYKDEQIQKIKFITIIYEFLSEYIEFPALNIPKIPTGLDIEDAANYLRDFWKLKRDEINNLVYIVEKNGIIVTNFETETGDVDAYSKKLELNSEQKFIVGYSNNKNTAARIHFDIAHELGHILLHD